jgi:ABC-type amino acid transport substrate-binding protein
MRAALIATLLLTVGSAQAWAAEKPLIVACAPGSPGTTAEAQPGLDALAAAVAQRAGWPADSLGAVYEPTEQGGVARLSRPEAAVALVSLPVWVKHGQALALEPRLQVVMQGATGPTEVWTLVARKGRVRSPESLAGFTLASTAGYAPDFVRGALAGWGKLPESVEVTQTRQVLSQLRKAASGADVAVLLDGTQTAALASLPFAGELEVVARSEPLPIGFVAMVDQRLPAAKRRALEQALVKLSESPSVPVLQGLRMSGFVPLDAVTLAKAKRLAGAAR